MDPADSIRVSRVRTYSGAFRESIVFRIPGYHRLWRAVPGRFSLVSCSPCCGPTTPAEHAPPVWAVPRSLAATEGIAVAFSSSRYLDVSVPRVCFPHRSLGTESLVFNQRGCPIRTSADHFVVANPRSFSQLSTSFVASKSLGILHAPIITSIPIFLSLDFALLPICQCTFLPP